MNYEGRFLDLSFDIAKNAISGHQEIVECIKSRTERSNADVIISSFLNYQFKPDGVSQFMYRHLVRNTLREDGILIEVGDELLTPSPNLRFKVNVYQKKNGELKHIGVPFVVDDQGNVLEINLNYFQ